MEEFKRNFCTITKASHHFVVRNPTPQITQIIYRLCEQYTQFAKVFDKVRKKNIWQPVKTYGLYVDEGREFRLHIGQFREFQEQLDNQYIPPASYKVVEKPMYEAADVELKIKDGWELYPQQREAVDFATAYENGDNRSPLIMMPTGSGKAQPLDVLIKIPDGWVPMKDISVGDTVIAKDGSQTEVTGVFPQGKIDTYQITFEDGRTTECSLDHLWKVYIQTKEKHEKVVTTSDLIHYLSKNTYKDRCYVDLPDPEVNSKKDLPLDPYTLGLFLGDRYSEKDNIFSTTIYSKTVNYPGEYLRGSIEQRLELVRGLMDMDGTVDSQSGTITYSTSNHRLAKDVQYLIRSLGGLAKISSRHTEYTYKGEILQNKENFNISIRYKKPSELFRLTRKKNLTNDENQYAKSLRLRIRTIEYIGQKESQCISISHPDRLYITDDFIPTHNTVTSLFAASELTKRLAIMVLGGYTEKWINDLKSVYDITEKDIVEIKGADILQRCTSFPSSKLPIPKIFVISINTMKSWYKLYEENINHPGLEAYECKPDDFFEHLGIGTVIYDEVHQHPHAVYQANCYMHVPKSVELSATLLSEDPILHKIQSVMFPHFKRFDKVKMKKYITAHACGYQIVDYATSKIQTTEFGSNMYSHVAFERSMLKHKKLRGQYLDMIVDLAERVYYKKKVAEDKLAIFVSSRIMAEALLERVKERFPDLDSRIYMQGSPLADAIDPDIRITTIISAGTALDIPNLRHTIMTINVKSPISNAQCLGRLREMKHRTENNDVHFWYTYCTTIPKQVDYHRNKIDLFKDRVIEQKDHFLATLYPY